MVAQFIVEEQPTGRPRGLVAGFNIDYRNANLELAVVAEDDSDMGAALVMEGASVFVDYIFSAFPIRKVYGHILEPNFRPFENLPKEVFAVEGRLRRHEYCDGQWVDMVIVAIHKDEWSARPSRLRFSSSGRDIHTSAPDSTLEAFRSEVSQVDGIVIPGDISQEQLLNLRLADDLGLDSLGLIELADIVDGGTGELPIEAVESMRTLGDAFHYFSVVLSRRDSQ